MAVPVPPLEHGRAALRAGDAATARRCFEQARSEIGDDRHVVEGLARADYLERRFADAIAGWERAYELHRAATDDVAAVRAARNLAYLHHAVAGQPAVSAGWHARALTLLASVDDPTSPEHGWVRLTGAVFDEDRPRKEAALRHALDVARATGDTELELIALGYLGASLVHGDRVEEGMLLLGEALAALAGGEVDDFLIIEEVFCQLFSACEHAHDVTRAEEWMRVGEAIAARRHLPAVAAFCRTHYGGVLTAAGRWGEADSALSEAVQLWDLGQRTRLRQGALARLADLRVRQGRLDEAARLLDGVDPDLELDGARAWAALHLARGDTAIAASVLERGLAGLPVGSGAAAPLLALLVEAELAGGRLPKALAAADALEACASAHPDHLYVQACAALARGRVCLAGGEGDPHACIRRALAGFDRAGLPMELGRCRLALASALTESEPDAAVAEAREALRVFEDLQAARDADAAASLLRALGVRASTGRHGADGLTGRERDVLELLAAGLSNPEIAEQLYISRKTVEHHVGNVLAKLGLRSRAEAAAWAARRDAGGG